MRFDLRYFIVAGVAICLVVLALSPLATVTIDDWSRRDVELRSKLLFNSIRDHVALSLAERQGAGLQAFFERLTDDERILAIAYCDASGTVLFPPS